ncbi:heat shock 70 kDa protein II-like [Planococcus citri]|uniref:heat shock 70 kDa protein II-like n=1 Tax=Planococcus citri TaxID=170843 RepID=UPI0031F84E6F
MDAPAIGIDLGTTYSCVGVFQYGKAEIIPNEQGNRTTPSYVAFTNDEILVGDAAKSQSARNVNNTVFDVKRLMGREYSDINVKADKKRWPFQIINDKNKPKIKVEFQGVSKTYFPEEISSMVLQKMKQSAEAYLGKTVKNAVITVPAYFNDSQRAATVDAAKIAGLNVLRIINEPTAAAIAYGLERKDSNCDLQNILIFDLGGGTFDVSILTIQGDVFEVISTAGDTHLGGEDIDNKLVDYFVKEFKSKFMTDLNENKKALNRLRTACERAKRILSSATVANIDIECLSDGIDFYTSITRARFEELNADFFHSVMAVVEKAIQDADIDESEIDHVVLVGGSSRIPKIQKMLQDVFDGKELSKSINADEAVAYGAAIQAAILNGDDESKQVPGVVLMDVTPMSLGIEVINTNGGDHKMSVVIKRNTQIPVTRTQLFYTAIDNKTSQWFRVFEGESDFSKDNNFLGMFELTAIPSGPACTTKMDVTFEIDANGILNVTAVERSTGSRNQITISYNKSRLSEDEIESSIVEAEQRQVTETKQKAVSAAKNSLESYCVDMKSTLEKAKFKNNIDKADKDIIAKKCDETILWLNSDQSAEAEIFERKLEELRKVFDVIVSMARNPSRNTAKYYEILNVPKNATDEQIKTSYRELASELHPDKSEGDKELANMYWLVVMKAKHALINSAKRMKFG